MNHCIDCGHRISRGRRWGTANETTRCLLCQTAQVMTTFRYVSPAAKRYWANKNAAQTRRRQRVEAGQVEMELS